MDKIRVYYDSKGNTLNAWFDDPQKEFVCEGIGEEVILAKDKTGKVIGFEKLNVVFSKEKLFKKLPLEMMVT